MNFSEHTARIIARLGVQVSLTPGGAPSRTVSGIFTQATAVAFGTIDGVFPTLRLTTSDADGLDYGDPVAVGGRVFTVARVRLDEASGTTLIDLEAA